MNDKTLALLLVIGIANFLAFFVVALLLGGDAFSGKVESGVFFLGSHGHFREVSRALWTYSYAHILSNFITFLLALLASAVLAVGRIASRKKRRSRHHLSRRGDRMDEKALFTGFWTKEFKTTRNVIARIPEGSDYRPDPKSRTAQAIAWQIFCEEKMIVEALKSSKMEWASPPTPATMKEILVAYEEQSAGMEQRWKALPAERWEGDLEFFGSQRPASPMAWSFLFDIVHHHRQIATYLRPMGSTVPRIYGPSEDEP